MTGKEDLFEISTTCVEIKNDVVGAIDFEIMKAMKMANDSLAKQLVKYKRAFELCTRLIHIDNNIEFGGDAYWIGDIERVSYITKEEYELLEELMKSE